jgi:omega-amidase
LISIFTENKNEGMDQSKEILNVALVQFDIAWENADKNLKKLDTLIAGIKQPVDIIVLPEAFNTGFSMNANMVVETMEGTAINWMKAKAFEYSCAVCGGVFIEEDIHNFNRFIWVHPNGKVESYDKRHLFSIQGENDKYTPGTKRVTFDYLGWKIFPQICYDLRFPVWSRNNLDYDLLINIANWPGTRRDVWQVLLQARSIENQCFTIGVNRIGSDEMGINYTGDSIAVDAKGNILHQSGNEENVTVVQLSLTELYAFRYKFDALKDKDSFLISF